MFSSVFPKAKDKFKEVFFANLNSETFDWDALVSTIIEEDSPLQEVFHEETVKFADIYDKALSLHKSAGKLDKVQDKNYDFDFSDIAEDDRLNNEEKVNGE